MEQLSKLELFRLLEIVQHVMDVAMMDDAGITWGLEDELREAREMLKKAIKTKKNNVDNNSLHP